MNQDLTYYHETVNDRNIFPEGKLFRIVFDSSVGKMRILCKTNQISEDIKNCFSDINPASFFVKQYGFQTAEKVYAINKFGYFDSGLIFDILSYIKTNYFDLSSLSISKKCQQYIMDYITPLRNKVKSEENSYFELANIADDSGKNEYLISQGKTPFEFRDYQYETLELVFKKGFGRGLIEIPTGGGKSFIIANYIWNLRKHFDSKLTFLILVPNKQLVEQFYTDLLDYGYNKFQVTRFTAGLKKNEKFNPKAMIIIANRQYMYNNFDQLPEIGCLICDEVHTATAEASKDLIEKFKCPLKLGCSGTIPREKYKKWTLVGMFSKIIYEKEITELQQKGYISNLKITLLKVVDSNVEKDNTLLFHPNSINKYKPDEFGYSAIAFNDAYNAEIEYFIKYYKELYTPILNIVKDLNGNSLILFDRIEFGSSMFELAKEILTDKEIFYIDGTIDVKVREEIRMRIENSSNCIIFGQCSCVSTGLNFKHLHNIIFFFSGKSFSRVIQSIGRTLRLSHDKDFANLYDISFNFKYSLRHLAERLKIYKTMYHKKKVDNIINLKI